MKTSPEDMNAFWTDEREEHPEKAAVRSRPIYDAVALLARCGVGVVFLAHGWQKIQVGVTATGHNFHGMGVPLPTAAAVYATFVELLGGAALILGVALPVAGTLLFLDMAGAFVFVHAQHGVFLVDKGRPRNGFELVLVLGLASLLFAAGGAGRLTLDHRLFGWGVAGRPPRRRRRARSDETPAALPPAGDAPQAPAPGKPAGGAPESPAPANAAGGAPDNAGDAATPARPRRVATGTSRDVRVAGPKPEQEPPADGAPSKGTPRARQRKGPSAKGS